MSSIVKYKFVSDQIVSLRSHDVILDFAVAKLYDVQTKEINQAVKNSSPRDMSLRLIIRSLHMGLCQNRHSLIPINGIGIDIK